MTSLAKMNLFGPIFESYEPWDMINCLIELFFKNISDYILFFLNRKLLWFSLIFFKIHTLELYHVLRNHDLVWNSDPYWDFWIRPILIDVLRIYSMGHTKIHLIFSHKSTNSYFSNNHWHFDNCHMDHMIWMLAQKYWFWLEILGLK